MMDELKSIEEIERVIVSCYGRQGQCALIKSSQQFILTCDGAQLLNLIRPSNNNYLYNNLIMKSINRHSMSHGDNCKSLFIYICEGLRQLFKSDKESQTAIRLLNIPFVIDHLTCLSSKAIDITAESIENFCVMYDLKKFNRNLFVLTSQLTRSLIQSYSNPSSIIDDLDHILVHSDRNSLQCSKIFTNGFLLDSKLHGFNHQSNRNQAIFMVKSDFDWSATTIDIKSSSNLEDVQRMQFFPNEFLETLDKHRINLVFYQGSMNEFKKQQLKNRSCLFVCFLNIEFIRFMCAKLNIQPVYEDEMTINNINDNMVVEIDSIELVEKENLYFYKLHKILVFVYFCSPIKAVFTQFKSHVLKVAKTLFTQNSPAAVIECNRFESSMAKLFSQLEYKYINETNNRLVCRFLKCFFLSLDFRLNHSSSSFSSSSSSNSQSMSLFYEPLNLKIAVLSECLTLIKLVSKIDFICVGKRNASLDEDDVVDDYC